MITQSPEFDSCNDLFAFIQALPWRCLRIVVWRGKWSATCVELAGRCRGQA